MSQLRYVGPPITDPADVVDRGYVGDLMDADMTAGQIDSRIAGQLTGFATKSYADARDALNATPAYVDAGDATRVKLAQKNIANGVAGLGASGQVPRNLIEVPDTQKYLKGPWSPSAYLDHIVTTSAEVALFPVVVADPGYPYRISVSGYVDAIPAWSPPSYAPSGAVIPSVIVRAGSASGPIVASGYGSSETYDYFGVDFFSRSGANLGGGWEEVWTGSGSGHARTDGNSAYYNRDGDSNDRYGFFRRLGNDATTIGNTQEIEWKTSSDCDGGTTFGTSARNFVCGRMSDDKLYWTGFAIDATDARHAYRSGGAVQLGGPVGCDNSSGTTFRARIGTEGGERTLQLIRNGTVVLTVNDPNSQIGSNRRGWGFGFRAGNNEAFGFPTSQTPPASLNHILCRDALPAVDRRGYAPVYVLPASPADTQTFTGPTTLYVRGTTSVSPGTVALGGQQSLFVHTLPA